MNRVNRLRLDAVARDLQDVASDDVDDVAESRIDGAWVLRRTALALGRSPRYGDDVELTTFCSGTGGRWAERRTTLAVDGSSVVEAVAIWVYVDRAGRPAPLGEWFFDHYGARPRGRKVSGRLSLPHPPADAHVRPWPVRASDFDLLGHVNNAAYWYAVEDELARLAPWRAGERSSSTGRRSSPATLSSSGRRSTATCCRCGSRHGGETRSAAQLRLGGRRGKRHARR